MCPDSDIFSLGFLLDSHPWSFFLILTALLLYHGWTHPIHPFLRLIFRTHSHQETYRLVFALMFGKQLLIFFRNGEGMITKLPIILLSFFSRDCVIKIWMQIKWLRLPDRKLELCMPETDLRAREINSSSLSSNRLDWKDLFFSCW